MSSRQLRKLQQQRTQKELEEAALAAAAEEESEDEPVRPQKSKPSLFANLAALEDEDSDEDGEKEDDSAKEELKEPDANPAPAPKAKKSKKKKKKAKKAKENSVKEGKDQDIDAALAELNLKPSPNSKAPETKTAFDPEYETVCKLLGIQTQHLKVANEMRNLFGKTSIENNDDAGGAVGREARRRGRGPQQVDLETALKGHHPRGKGLPEVTLRRNPFIQGKDDWPKASAGGLSMVVVDDQRSVDGTMEFRYVHDKTYQALQQTFHGYVEMGDPQNLIALLTRNRKFLQLEETYPAKILAYHISLLIQVSKIAKDQTDHALSSDLLERALFNFGRASTSLFASKLTAGKARLDFSRPENRELWLAGYQYIKSLVMKGTYRTAFEWTKLLLSLDPEGDPYCMRLMIHNLALRCRQFEWLLEMCDTNTASALASEIPLRRLGSSKWHNTPSLALAAQQLKDGKRCRELLTASMQSLPWLFVRLFQELNLEVPKSIWGITPRTDAENLFTSLYIQQTKDLWNTTATTALLMEIAHTIPKVDDRDLEKVSNDDMDLDVVRFVYLDNTPALMALVPSALLHKSNNSDADPIPPDHNLFSYEAQRDALRGHAERGESPFAGLFDPIAALRQFLPDFPMFPGTRNAEDDDDDDDDFDRDATLREHLEASIADDGNGRPMPVGMARRLLNMLWRQEDGDEEEEEEDEVTDSDSLPELVALDDNGELVEGEGEESDDEMPELVD
jgi:hypothetical protein